MYCVANYQQSLPLTWLQNPTEKNKAALLEFSRGTLYSLSNSNKQNGGEVHVSRFRNAFAKLGSPSLYRVGLKLLKLLREAEPLPGGYWIPTPFRVLQIDKYPVFIGALPTALRFLDQDACEGLCRILTPEAASIFPRQDISSWMGVSSNGPSSEVTRFFKGHQRSAVPANNETDVDFFSLAPNASKWKSNTRQFMWGSRPSSLAGKQVALCRQRSFGFYRYFSSDLRSGHATSEAAVEQSIPRLLFSFAHFLGSPVPIRVCDGTEGVEVSIEEQLPLEEYRLALLLSRRIEYRGRCRTFHIVPQFAPTFIRRLQDLGCVMETNE